MPQVFKEKLANVERMDQRETRAGPDDQEVKVYQAPQVTMANMDHQDLPDPLAKPAHLVREDCLADLANLDLQAALAILDIEDHLEMMDQRDLMAHQAHQDLQGLPDMVVFIHLNHQELIKEMTPIISMISPLRIEMLFLLV